MFLLLQHPALQKQIVFIQQQMLAMAVLMATKVMVVVVVLQHQDAIMDLLTVIHALKVIICQQLLLALP